MRPYFIHSSLYKGSPASGKTRHTHGIRLAPAGLRQLPRLLSLLVLASLGVIAAEETCVEKLAIAKNHYHFGRFDQVRAVLENCLDFGFDDEQKPEALALLAKAQIADDEIEKAKATIYKLLRFDPNYRAGSDDPRYFRDEIARFQQAREGKDTQEVTSVSKIKESLLEVPATVIVVDREDIIRRGYSDLEALLHDLPGFDMQRGNGILYSNFNQRGYRSSNDRTLFLVDGVEDNDLWQNVAFISRQYSLSNIERVEVIYGPASTMYGPNAFVGVINLITRDPRALIKSDGQFGVHALLGAGEWKTRYADVTLAWKHAFREISLSLTTRVFQSDEADLSDYADWDYDPAFYERTDYPAELGNDPALLERARQFDKDALAQVVGGEPVKFSDITDDWSVQGKLRFTHFTIGFQHWRREEGYNSWYTDDFYAGAKNGVVWVPEQTNLWARYQTNIGQSLRLTLLTQFKRQRLDDNSGEQVLFNYASGDLKLADLEKGIRSFWRRTFYDQSSRQTRAEAGLVYQPSPKFNIVSGLEVRESLLQGDYQLTVDCPNEANGLCPTGNRTNDRAQFFDQIDVGLFAQASWQARTDLKLILGGRVDNNTVRVSGGTFTIPGVEKAEEPEGYGSVFNPRLAVIWTPENWVFKAIYAEAVKDASQFNRYATSPGFRDLPSPNLQPEKVKNLELSASWQVNASFLVDLAAYKADYSNAVAPQQVTYFNSTTGLDTDTLQNQAIGTLEIKGLQGNLRYRFERGSFYANYTWTEPINENFPLINQDASVTPITARITDIADHQLNLGVTRNYFGSLFVNLRANWSGLRQTGKGTTSPDNLSREDNNYLVFNSAITYENTRLRGLRLQLNVANLSNQSFTNPGVLTASGVLASSLPQPERSFSFRLIYDF